MVAFYSYLSITTIVSWIFDDFMWTWYLLQLAKPSLRPIQRRQISTFHQLHRLITNQSFLEPPWTDQFGKVHQPLLFLKIRVLSWRQENVIWCLLWRLDLEDLVVAFHTRENYDASEWELEAFLLGESEVFYCDELYVLDEDLGFAA